MRKSINLAYQTTKQLSKMETLVKKSIEELGLTSLENQVLVTLIDLLYAEAGFSDVDVNDLEKVTEISSKILRGALGSLVKKGILSIDQDSPGGYDLIYLEERYWYLHSESWAAESRF